MDILWRVRVWLRRLLGRYPDPIHVHGVDAEGHLTCPDGADCPERGDPCSPESSGGMPS